MKKNFRLQKVLEYRERLVDLEKNKLAEINSKLERTKLKSAELLTAGSEVCMISI